MRTYLIDSFMSRDRPQALRDAARCLRQVIGTLAAEGSAVVYLRTAFLPGDERCLHTLQADQATTVREATKRAGIAPERVIEALPVQSGGQTP
jgi:hypothetical protein